MRVRDGVAVLWCEPYPCDAPNAWIIAGTTREAAANVATCASIMRADEFEAEVVERIGTAPDGSG